MAFVGCHCVTYYYINHECMHHAIMDTRLSDDLLRLTTIVINDTHFVHNIYKLTMMNI